MIAIASKGHCNGAESQSATIRPQIGYERTCPDQCNVAFSAVPSLSVPHPQSMQRPTRTYLFHADTTTNAQDFRDVRKLALLFHLHNGTTASHQIMVVVDRAGTRTSRLVSFEVSSSSHPTPTLVTHHNPLPTATTTTTTPCHCRHRVGLRRATPGVASRP